MPDRRVYVYNTFALYTRGGLYRLANVGWSFASAIAFPDRPGEAGGGLAQSGIAQCAGVTALDQTHRPPPADGLLRLRLPRRSRGSWGPGRENKFVSSQPSVTVTVTLPRAGPALSAVRPCDRCQRTGGTVRALTNSAGVRHGPGRPSQLFRAERRPEWLGQRVSQVFGRSNVPWIPVEVWGVIQHSECGHLQDSVTRVFIAA